MQAVDVLGRIDSAQQRVLIQPGRLLDDEAGACRVGVQLVDRSLCLGLRRASR